MLTEKDSPREEDLEFNLDVRCIDVGDRARQEFDDIDGLRDSISKIGFIHPIVVIEDVEKPGRYKLIAGERRLRAALSLGKVRVPCTLRENLSDIELKAMELEENVKRKNFTWEEECRALEQLDQIKREMEGSSIQGIKTDGWSQRKTAELVGKSLGSVNEQINLAKLMKDRPDIAEKIKKLPMRVAIKASKTILENERIDARRERGEIKLSSQLRLGDALELVKELDDESIGLVLTDPPFGIPILAKDSGTDGRYDYTKPGASGALPFTSTLKAADNATIAEVELLFFKLSSELDRVLVPGGHLYVFFAFECLTILEKSLGEFFEVDPVPLIWYK